jgi:hypothetical protein
MLPWFLQTKRVISTIDWRTVTQIKNFWNSLGIVGKLVILLIAALVLPALLHPVYIVVAIVCVVVVARRKAKAKQ